MVAHSSNSRMVVESPQARLSPRKSARSTYRSPSASPRAPQELELTPPRSQTISLIGKDTSSILPNIEVDVLLPGAGNDISPDKIKKDALVGTGLNVNGAAIAKNPWTKWVAYVVLVFVECSIGLLGKVAQTDG